MNIRRYSGIKTIIAGFARVAAIVLIGAAILFQVYVLITQREGASSLPDYFGNFATVRATLEKQHEKDEFSFAVVGDTMSHGTFECIVQELRKARLDFAVLLGDCAYKGTEEEHRYFRAECADEYALPFPVFYVVGNHDVSPDHFPISRFEHDYGPSIFSFEYQGCLFIMLRIIESPYSNEESLAFLRSFQDLPLEEYRHTFVFMHTPPPVSSYVKARSYTEHERLVKIIDELGIDYVFAGDFHGYARVKRGETTYIVTGGGGGHLNEKIGPQFHHAFVMHVGKHSVTEILVPVVRHTNFEDRLERFAITEAWPWMRQNLMFVWAVNGLSIFILFALLWPITTRAGKKR